MRVSGAPVGAVICMIIAREGPKLNKICSYFVLVAGYLMNCDKPMRQCAGHMHEYSPQVLVFLAEPAPVGVVQRRL